MLKEAREIKSKLISDAEEEAKIRAKKMVEAAKTAIQNEKNSAMNELKNTVVDLSVGIAEKLISEELADKDKQLKMIEDILEDSKLK
jgi:F-type H+-transporting ATPase subunit b